MRSAMFAIEKFLSQSDPMNAVALIDLQRLILTTFLTLL